MPQDLGEPAPTFEVTAFDKERLKAVEVGGVVKGEYGTWEVHRYENSYFLLTNVPRNRKIPLSIDCDSLSDLYSVFKKYNK